MKFVIELRPLALAAIFCLAHCSTSAAQFAVPRTGANTDVFLNAPRVLLRLLQEGKTAIADGRYADGVAALGSIIQDDNQDIPADLRGQDFFFKQPAVDVFDPRQRGEKATLITSTQSIKGEAFKELLKLPEEGRKSFEIQFGVQARQLLDEAIAKRDLQGIAAVARRYFNTEAADEAMLLMAQQNYVNGFPLSAADILQRLVESPAARQRFGVELVEACTIYWLKAGQRAKALAALELGGKYFPGQSLTIDGQQIPIEKTEQLFGLLEPEMQSRFSDLNAKSWLVSGGSPSRNATAEVSEPLPNKMWEVPIHSSRPESLALQEAEEAERKKGRSLLPKIELRLLDNVVISRSNDSTILGIELDTGIVKWRPSTIGSVARLKDPAWESSDSHISSELKNRIWGSTAFGRISCDNQHCYHVTYDQNEVEVASRNNALGMGYGNRRQVTTRLQAISVASEGAIVWSVGASDSNEPLLRNAFFLGPPLPYSGNLYCLVEINGQIELVVLEPGTGKLLWKQQLAASLVQIDFDVARQSQGLSPSIADGMIVCPTGVGGLVAIDLVNRSLRWGINYQLANNRGYSGSSFGQNDLEPMESRWHDEGLIIENGVIAFTPPETEVLLCIDLLTGEEVMQRRRSNGCYVAGIRENELILVSPNSIQAIPISRDRQDKTRSRTEDRPLKWELLLPSGTQTVGKGIWQRESMLLPVTGNQVVSIDLKQGKISKTTNVDDSLGNLFAYNGMLLAVGPTKITAYATRNHLEATVNQKLALNAKDPWALNHKSQLLLASGKTREAFELLLEAYAAQPNDHDTRFYLVDAMLAGLKEDFPAFAKYAEQLDEIVSPGTPERLKYLQYLATGLSQQADHYAAFQRLWEIMIERQMSLVQGDQSRFGKLQMDASWQVDLDAWFATELGRNYDRCTSEQKAQIGTQVNELLDRLRSTVVTVRRQVLRHLIFVSAADAENLTLADTLLQMKEFTSAEQILSLLATSSLTQTRAVAKQKLYSLPEPDSELASAAIKDVQWPEGSVQRQMNESDEAIYSGRRPVELTGDRFGRPLFNLSYSERLFLTDPNGKALFQLGYRQATTDYIVGMSMRGEVRGGLMLLETNSEVIAFDFFKGRRDSTQSLMWRYSLEAGSPRESFQVRGLDSSQPPLGIQRINRLKSDDRPHAAFGPLFISAKVVQTGNKIIGLDPLTGRKLWARDGYGKDVQLVGKYDSNLLCAVCPAKKRTELIDARDGKLVNQNQFLIDDISQRWGDANRRKWEQWFTYGSWVVDFVEEDNAVRLRAWNPFDEKVLFESKLPPQARVAQCQQRFIAIAIPNGQLQLVDLETLQVKKHELAVDNELLSLGLLKFGEHLVVVANRSEAVNRQMVEISGELAANGFLYCVDAASLEVQWSGRIHNMVIPLNQPRTSPMMVAYRFLNPGTANSTISLIDLRRGRVAYVIEGPALERHQFSMEIRPESHEIALMSGEKFYRLRLTDEPGPPEPQMDFGSVYRPDPMIKRDNSSLFDQ